MVGQESRAPVELALEALVTVRFESVCLMFTSSVCLGLTSVWGPPRTMLRVGVVAGVCTLWLPQVARRLWWEEAAVVPLKLCGRDDQSCNPRAGEGGMCGTTLYHRFVSLSPGSLLMCLSHPGLPVICESHSLCGHTLVSIVPMSCLAGSV